MQPLTRDEWTGEQVVPQIPGVTSRLFELHGREGATRAGAPRAVAARESDRC